MNPKTSSLFNLFRTHFRLVVCHNFFWGGQERVGEWHFFVMTAKFPQFYYQSRWLCFLTPGSVRISAECAPIPQLRLQTSVCTMTASTENVDHDSPPLVPKSGRVAIIGAGAAGLQAARQLEAAGYSPHIYEASDHVGGVWAYSPQPDTTSPMYDSLHCNLPKYFMMFEGIPHPPHVASYPSHRDVLEYVRNYAHRYDLLRFISFKESVTGVSKETGMWRVQTNRGASDFHALYVCSGNFAKAREWEVDGAQYLRSRGIRVRHSLTYRTPEGYENRVVAVIGAGPSGIDIALELAKVAKHVYLSHSFDSKVISVHRPSNLSEVGVITHVSEDGTLHHDKDVEGNGLSVDSVLACTGYVKTVPFLGLLPGKGALAGVHVWPDGRSVRGLVRHCVGREDATLIFIGLPQKMIPFPTFEEQIAFSIQVLKGNISPQQLKRLAGEEDAVAKDDKKYQVLGKRQWEYVCELAELAGRCPINPSLIEICWHSSQQRRDDPAWYRNMQYILTGEGKGMWTVKG